MNSDVFGIVKANSRINMMLIDSWKELFYSLNWTAFVLTLIIWDGLDHTFNGWYALTPILLSLIWYLYNSKWPNSPCLSLVHWVRVFGVVGRTFLITSCMLKITGTLNWKWATTLWVFWWYLAIMVVISGLTFWLAVYCIVMFFKRKYPYHTVTCALFWFYVCFGLTFFSTVIAIDLIIRNDIPNKSDEGSIAENNATANDLPWRKQDPMLFMFFFLWSIFAFSILFYKYILLWFNRLLYNDEPLRIEPINVIEPSVDESHNQI